MNQIEKKTPVYSDASINPVRRCRRQVRAALLALVGAGALLAALGAAPAMATTCNNPPDEPGHAQLCATLTNSVINQDGTPATQAGSHPWEMVTDVKFNTIQPPGTPPPPPNPANNVKDVDVTLPPGLVGNPNALPRCTAEELANGGLIGGSGPGCPLTSQVGDLTVFLNTGSFTAPLYNIVPPAGEPAQFGANILLANSFLDVSVVHTPHGYALQTDSSDISGLLPLVEINVTLWGVPADPSHDADRPCPGGSTPCSSNGPMNPLLTLPTSCTGQLSSTLTVDSWTDPGDFTPPDTSTMGPMTGCGSLPFNPSISVQPDAHSADSPTGLAVDVHVPQANHSPNSLATSMLQNADVTLPSGVAVNPAAADGLQACSEAQIGLDNTSQPTCPDASKIGSAEIDSPIQADPLTGSIYLAQQTSNPFGSLLAIYVAVQSDGVLIKLAGELVPDPNTGQLQTIFTNNPELPFTDFKLNFYGGNRATLVTGDSCGTFTTTSSLAPWSGGAAATPSDSFTINSGCVIGFAPTFLGGVTNAQAGAYSPFVLSFGRSDTDQEISGLKVTLPPGVLANLGKVPLCPDANANAGTCPASSRVGTVKIGSGAGSNPFFLPGSVYLTGPYKGGPYGLAVVVPVLAGPLNLGTVVVRQSIRVDPTDAHVTVVSDPFPTILDGIPLRIRRVDVSLNRRNFTVNPTSCNHMSVTGVLSSTGGAVSSGTSPFQVGGCLALGFSPKLKLSLTGKGKTRSGDHPTLKANLTQKSGQANIKSAKVTLPLSLALDPKNSKHVCAFATAQAVHGGTVGCPSSTIVGSASAKTPLLSAPLSGKIYLVQGIRTNAQGQQIRTLPSLLVPLRGAVALDLRAKTSVSKGKLVTTFPTVPDVPVSSFKLNISGGKKGLLVITGRGRSICGKVQKSAATLKAQSGKQESSSITMATPCRHVAKHHKKSKKHKK
jgi:hypothetical protein